MKRPAKSPSPAAKTAASPAKSTVAKQSAVKPLAKAAHRSLCPINLVLEAVGDSWSLLIIRDLMFRGHTGYQAFLRSEERIATNILADRLVKLEQHGLISKAADPKDARKFIYGLTEKGAHLAPILVEMALYSAKFAPRIDMPKEVMADMQRNKVAFASRMTRHNMPRPKGKRPDKRTKNEGLDTAEETLSLF